MRDYVSFTYNVFGVGTDHCSDVDSTSWEQNVLKERIIHVPRLHPRNEVSKIGPKRRGNENSRHPGSGYCVFLFVLLWVNVVVVDLI